MPDNPIPPHRWRQYGRSIALITLTCFVGWFGLQAFLTPQAKRLRQRFEEFEVARTTGRASEAYAIMSPVYRERTTLEEFTSWHMGHRSGFPGAKISVEVWLGHNGYVWVGSYGDGLWRGKKFRWMRIQGEWYYTDVVDEFID